MGSLLDACLRGSASMDLVVRPDGTVVDFSDNVLTFLDRTPDTLRGQPVWTLGHNVTRENWPGFVEAAARHRIVEYDTISTSSDSRAHRLRLRFEYIDNPGASPLVLARGMLLPEPRVEAGPFGERWFRFVHEFGDDGFWIFDIRSQRVTCNRQWYERLGLEPQPADALAVLQERLHPDDLRDMQPAYGALIAGQRARLSARARLRHADGHYLWMRHRAYVVARDPEGRAMMLVGHDVDISAEVEAERRAQASERALRDLIERIPTAVIVYRPDATPRLWNSAAARLLGVSEGDVADEIAERRRQGWQLVDERGEPFGDNPIMRALRTGEPVADTVVGVTTGDRQIWGLMNAAPGFDAAGQMQDVVCTVADITRTRELEAGLARAQRLESVGRLASGVAHDFNNLLTVVVTSVELLEDAIDPASPAGADLAELRYAARRGTELTRQLLSYGRQTAVDARPIDLGTRIEASMGLLRRLLPVDIELEARIADDLWPVRFDPARLDQILVNLTVNAADAMQQTGGSVVLAASNVTRDGPSDWVRLQVIDTGSGMSEAVRRQALEPFFTTKSVGAGTGLGLSTCRALVLEQHGELRIRSAIGVGTTVEIDLPRTAGRPEASTPPAPVDRGSARGTVLLVEDEPRVMQVMRRALSFEGYRVVIARDGLEAMRRLDEGADPDVVVTDVAMPGVDGPALMRLLERLRPGLPVLFTSGHDDPTLARHGVDRAAVEFLAKPFGPGRLVERLASLLQRSNSRSASGPPTDDDQSRSPPSMSRQRPVK